MRIVHILTVPLSFRLLKGQATYLKSRGVEVHAVSSPGPLADLYERSEPVTVHRVSMTRRMTPFADLNALFQLFMLLRRLRPDVVQCGTPKAGLLGVLAAWLAGVPTRIYHVRGLPLVTATGLRRRILKVSERLACAAATHVLAVSHSMRQVLHAERICSAQQVDVILDGSSNGVDVDRFCLHGLRTGRAATRARLGIPADAAVIGFVGRLVREKGIVELLEAWRRLAAVHQDLHLLLVGPFERGDAVAQDVRYAVDRDPRIHLTGLEWDTPSLYATMDVFCLPSHREGFPNVILEAAALQVPVVAHRIPGVVDAVVDGVTGTLVPVRHPESLERALHRYIVSAELRAEHGTAGRERVLRSFAQEDVWSALYDYYRTAAAPKPVSTEVKGPGRKVLHVVTVPMTLEFMIGQAAFMGDRNISLSFVSSPGHEQAPFAARERVTVYSVEMSRRITPFKDCLSIARLIRLIRRLRPDIVHAHTPKAGLVAMIGSRIAGVPVRIYHLHGLPYETATGAKRLIQMACERVACRLASRVLSVSESVKRRVVSDAICTAGKIRVLGAGSIAGVDAEYAFNPRNMPEARQGIRSRLGVPGDAVVVGFVGRLARDKGIETLWRAWQQVRNESTSTHLIVIGPYDSARLDQEVPQAVLDALSSDTRVHLVGAVPRHDLPQYYAAMDMLCLPTYREGFPVTLLEAAAMGLPCVATQVTGCVDAVVAGRTGVLVEAGDAAALKTALIGYINDPPLRLAHGDAARARVREDFTPQRLWGALETEYSSLAGWQAA